MSAVILFHAHHQAHGDAAYKPCEVIAFPKERIVRAVFECPAHPWLIFYCRWLALWGMA